MFSLPARDGKVAGRQKIGACYGSVFGDQLVEENEARSADEQKEDIFSEIKGKMAGISEKEKGTLQKLFIQVQEIEELEKEEKGIVRDVEK
ncbi:MAG: hypothetical protein N2Z84_04250, partial [Atribacterota bacterium]|nr:hypothetical protein [Atribacterota bacterium]